MFIHVPTPYIQSPEFFRMLVTNFRIPEQAYSGTNTRGLLAVSLFEMKSNIRVK